MLTHRQLLKIAKLRPSRMKKHYILLGDERLAVIQKFINYIYARHSYIALEDRCRISIKLSSSGRATTAALNNSNRILYIIVNEAIREHFAS